MKLKLIAGALAILLLMGLPMNVSAVGLTVPQSEAVRGETISFEVRLTEEITTKSGSVKIEYDPNLLTVESYTWHLEDAVIQFFDPATGEGVFACMAPICVGDLIFSVVFRVAENAEYGDSSVSVGMQFTNADNPADDVVIEAVSGGIYVVCADHQPTGATCTQPATCSVCGAVCGPTLEHDYFRGVCTLCGDTIELPTYTVGGTVESYLADGPVTIELIQDGVTYYTTVVNTQTAAYALEGVLEGTYTMRVSKENHMTREYEVVVNGADVTCDAKLCPKGDVTGDGVVNIKDFQRLLRHVNKTNALADYALACGDVTGDGACNIKDFQRLLRHVNKTNPLF